MFEHATMDRHVTLAQTQPAMDQRYEQFARTSLGM